MTKPKFSLHVKCYLNAKEAIFAVWPVSLKIRNNTVVYLCDDGSGDMRNIPEWRLLTIAEYQNGVKSGKFSMSVDRYNDLVVKER